MYCPNCGHSNPDGCQFCTNCGRPLNGGNPNAYAQQPVHTQNRPRAPIASRGIGMAIFLSIITCGIYSIFWLISLVNDLNTASDSPSDTSGGMVFLLGLVTCGIYYIYWFYKAGQKVSAVQRKYSGIASSDNSLIYLLLSIFGLEIVAMALIQSELNKVASQN